MCTPGVYPSDCIEVQGMDPVQPCCNYKIIIIIIIIIIVTVVSLHVEF